jgi:hypothetical protein
MKRWWYMSLLLALGCGSFEQALRTYCTGELNCQKLDGTACTRAAECLSDVCVAGRCGQPAHQCASSAPALVAMSTKDGKLSVVRVQLQPGWEENPDKKLVESESAVSSPGFQLADGAISYLSPTSSTAYIGGVSKSGGSNNAVLGRVLLAPNRPETVDSMVDFPAAFLPQSIFSPDVNTVIALGPMNARRIALNGSPRSWLLVNGEDRLGTPRSLVTFNEELGRIVTVNSRDKAVTVSKLGQQNEVLDNAKTFSFDTLGQGEATDVATQNSIGLLRQEPKESTFSVWLMDLEFADRDDKRKLALVRLQDLPPRDTEPFKPYRVVGLPNHALGAWYFLGRQHFLVVVAANGKKGTLSLSSASSMTETPLDFFLHCP